jgi:hypothetical protein
MYDVLVPMFNLQLLFGMYTRDAQILILGAQGGDEELMRKDLPRNLNTADADQSVLRLTWDHDAALLGDYARSVLGEGSAGLVCFEVGSPVQRPAGQGALSGGTEIWEWQLFKSR